MIKQADAQKQAAGLQHIRQSMVLWEKVRQNFQNNPPEEYRQDEKFSSRLLDIYQGMQNMERQLADGDFNEALQTCSKTCGLFVRMHEENGLICAADRLFHLRKQAKKMVDEAQQSDIEPLKEMIGELLKLRDNVLCAPCPAPEDSLRCQNYREALKTLSAQIDELTIQLVNGKHIEAQAALKSLLAAINLAYGIAL
ncbi:MAG: hypothetical protein NUW13_06725 [candidate division KSB1 bacterium]|nr:hypothetical protein [candidate division KSB1 bacterium]